MNVPNGQLCCDQCHGTGYENVGEEIGACRNCNPAKQAINESDGVLHYQIEDGSHVFELVNHPMRIVLIYDETGFHLMWCESGECKSVWRSGSGIVDAAIDKAIKETSNGR